MDYSRPDWVITGGPLPDGRVQLIASTDLRVASLNHRQERLWDGANPNNLFEGFEPGGTVTDLKVTMKQFTVVVADNYPAALFDLFNQWHPEASAKPAIEAFTAERKGEHRHA